MKFLIRFCSLRLAVATLLLAAVSGALAAGNDALVYVGTYTGAKSKGIYFFRMNLDTGDTTPLELAAETISPSFLALHPSHKFIYSVNEVDKFNGQPGGGVSAFAIDAQSGKLTLLNQQTSGGSGPCHIEIDKTGRCVIVANYNSGSFEALPVGKDGKLGAPSWFRQDAGVGADPARQKGPHAHCVTLDGANRYAFACDLGLDKVFSYKLDPAAAKLTPNDPAWTPIKPTSGPRHIAFDPSYRHAYVISELGSIITAFNYDAARGHLEETQIVSTLPDNFKGNNSTAEVVVHPNGKFVYGSNRGHNSLAIFAIDPKLGTLTFVAHEPTQGKAPRHFAIDPSGNWLLAANQDSDNIVFFKIDQATGRLTPTGKTISAGMPVCVTFLPAH